MTAPRAKNSPLRDYMLELHKMGIKVTFYEGRPEVLEDKSQMFFVEMPAGYSIEQHVEILRKIQSAIKLSAELVSKEPRAKLTRQVAANYVSKLKLFKEHSKNK